MYLNLFTILISWKQWCIRLILISNRQKDAHANEFHSENSDETEDDSSDDERNEDEDSDH